MEKSEDIRRQSILFYGVMLSDDDFSWVSFKMTVPFEFVTTIGADCHILHPPGCLRMASSGFGDKFSFDPSDPQYVDIPHWRERCPNASIRWDSHGTDEINLFSEIEKASGKKACLQMALLMFDVVDGWKCIDTRKGK